MAFSASFSATQVLGLPQNIILTDTSTGSTTGITSRRVYLEQYNGSFLVPSGTTTSYIVWPFAQGSITLDVLTVDMALSITVQWLNVTGDVLYTSTQLVEFYMYNAQFDYGLTSDQAADPLIVNDTEYYMNRIKLRVNMDSAIQAVSLGADITNAQYSNNRATYLRLNENLYF